MKALNKNSNLLAWPVTFIRGTDQASDELQEHPKKGKSSQPLSGREARDIYEKILKEPGTNHTESKPQLRLNSQHTQASCLKRKSDSPNEDRKPEVKKAASGASPAQARTKFFKAAENGWLLELQTLLASRLVDIDSTDQYKWTALMMAAYGGHSDAVLYLLVNGAQWKDLVDDSGYDAYDLANLGGNSEIAHMLIHSKSLIKYIARQRTLELALKQVKKEKLWCDVCGCRYAATASGEEATNPHHSSISHRISAYQREPPPPSSHFYLGRSNRGYRMLQGGGWDETSGLGPTGKGQKYPVKTVLKRDRCGLGCTASSSKARVTHFAANDNDAVKTVVSAGAGKTKTKAVERDKNLEIEFRRSFY